MSTTDLFAAVRTRNRELLEAEAGGPTEDLRTANRRKTTASAIELSDDEGAIAASLPPVRSTALLDDTDNEDGGTPRNAGEDEDLHAELGDIDMDDVDIEMDMSTGEGDLSNQVSYTTLFKGRKLTFSC